MMKKSNIEWCDFTWDPVTGCRKDCSFCESRKRLSHFKGDIRFHLSDERIQDRKSTRLNSSHITRSRMPSSA